ncbi:hypothetical protein CLU79DRAFT_847732 [Phycomyces nitens]|nr:hypothetical protein CLU79DRAFT_847732 [Phycomyces nitens]
MSAFNDFIKTFIEKSCPKLEPVIGDDQTTVVSDPQPSLDLFGSIEQVSQSVYPGSPSVPISDPFPANGNLSLGFLSVPSSFGSFSSVSESLAGFDTSLFSFEDNGSFRETNNPVLPEFEGDDLFSMCLSQYPDIPFSLPSSQSPFPSVFQPSYSPTDILLSPMAGLFPISPIIQSDSSANPIDPSLYQSNTSFGISPGTSTEPWSPMEAYVGPSNRSFPVKQIRHKCPYCMHSSNRANNMKEHILTHDPNRQKNFVCHCCQKAFARKHDLKRHIKAHERHNTYTTGK